MNNPISTYRLQFHKEFTFADFEKIIPYLKKLGVSTIYASPIFHSTAGSTHGYDGMNPHQIDPEIGTEEQFVNLSKDLKEQGFSWLQDIVPNHMAFHPENPWLQDVLEKGLQSVYASYFDIDWKKGKLMAPFLGSSLEDAVKNKDLKLDYKNGRFGLSYYDTFYPVNLRSYQIILNHSDLSSDSAKQLVQELNLIHQTEDSSLFAKHWDEFLLQLSSSLKSSSQKTSIDRRIESINNDPELLLDLANEQNYRLCYWQETDTTTNFRRFFTVNGLICLNIQEPGVFEHFHQYIQQLIEKGILQGLRVDHIDGLHNPANYLEDLRKLCGEDTYIVVEKILEPGEELPKWPIQGNTGYDFLAQVNNLFTNPKSENQFSKFYDKLVGGKSSIHQQIHDKKAYILYNHMQGELENLYQLFIDLELADTFELQTVDQASLKKAIGEFLIICPVYRYYGNQFPLKSNEEEAIHNIFKQIKKHKPELSAPASILEKALIQKPKTASSDYNVKALSFYQRCMQFTGPLMAKGVEDTLMYTYNRFIAHNEVGDSPEEFGQSIDHFHQQMIERQHNWPLSINGTSTHDTKRGEDVRARLNVLADLPDEWFDTVKMWQYLNASLKQDNAPDANDEYFIYQTITGSYPMPGESVENYSERLHEYFDKALREAKRHSNWTEPNQQYEAATKKFVYSLLEPGKPFGKHFQTFQKKIVDYGIVNSLAQVLLKFTCPGVPDVYQGCELWDLSLVDPDNRRPVDYEMRQQWLNELKSSQKPAEELLHELWEDRYTGKIKLWLTNTLFNERKNEKDTFEKGEYIPLKVKGKYKENILAFARRHKQTWYIVVVPLHLAELAKEQQKGLHNFKWKETRVVLPDDSPKEWENILLKTKGKAENTLLVKDLFSNLPFAVLKLKQPNNERGAGVLLHITSLPSHFGIGDFGSEAKKFANFLSRSKQKYWQILPLSATEAGQGHSPYSAISSMAGNTLLISPDALVTEELLDSHDLQGLRLPSKDKVNFKEAEKIKDELFDKAYKNFISRGFEDLHSGFESFCKNEAQWLDSYALYVALKLYHSGKPWYQWNEEYKMRNQESLLNFSLRESYTIQKAKWLQFIFMKQWKDLKMHCNTLGIQLFGDLPFYVSYDSADVWANPEIFCLDSEGKQTGTAGVPPDYFNENGQLWGMPIFRWDVLKAQGYEWWINRIKKNMELFDVLRLDHFRAFSSYWDVPAGEETAKNGEWKPGPSSDFFKVLESKLGKLPFIAEDLGDIDQPVYDLRDEFNFPGMKVLQFAFGDNLPNSIDIPHNYSTNFFVYTGTHDNNTTIGWYNQETDKNSRKRLEAYVGKKVTEKNIHKILARLGYSSVAKVVILPLQDIIGLNENARMNTPAGEGEHWSWRLQPNQLNAKHQKRLKKWTSLYNRE